jgi:hypothetical protein
LAKANSARRAPVKQRAKLRRRRKLTKPNSEQEFFFIGGFRVAYSGE